MTRTRDRRGTRPAVSAGKRAVSPVVGVVVLLALTVVLGAVVAVGVNAWVLASPGPTASFDLSVDGDRSVIEIEHVAGERIDVESLSVMITVNGRALRAQPPVPFVGASGFNGTPDGPFNSRADSDWTAGERAAVSVAATNTPALETGDSVSVTLTVDGRRIAALETTAT
ncbi:MULTISPECIES: type IV pilin [Natrinema]|uniref:Archaeal Type IV pilin N-terminal domain-containing protein n=1 Tax=Natrinema gari JCM 14663 TaxID=1230459 RepID=L9Z471_9EURY|nr:MULTISPECIES: type IV pilin [Natrinema]AFO58006.1 hypothetical protein NJ7G_2778 [Natrinema sp. J7-2]ELY79973.1 hypothetical protein C486_09675 [Natrinema gari JCM 14663]